MKTSWTLNTTVIWSNTSDVSPNTTLNLTTTFEEETGTTGVSPLIIVFIVAIPALIVTAIIGVKPVRLLRGADSQRYENVPPNPLNDDAGEERVVV